MESALVSLRNPKFVPKSSPSPTPRRATTNRRFPEFCCCSSFSSLDDETKSTTLSASNQGRRALVTYFLNAAAGLCISDVADAASTSRRALRGAKVPESDFTTLPNGLKYYDLKVGSGPEAVKGSRVAVWL